MTLLGSRYSPTAGLPFDDAELESRLVWIWGSPRSGSTWLLEQLCHPLIPDVSAASGVRVRSRSVSGGNEDPPPCDALPVDESFISNHLAPAFGEPIEVDDSYVPATLNNWASGKPSYAFSHAFREVWRPEFRRLALLRLNSAADRAAADGIPLDPSPSIVVKEVNGSHAADLVMALLPRSRMLFLVRDGRDVVDSLLAAYAPGGFLARNQGYSFGTPEEREEGLRWACRLWACNVDVTLRAHADHPPELRRIVRYEDLLADTEATIGPIFGWLGLRRDREWLRAMVAERSFSAVPDRRRGWGRRQRAASPGLWRRNLTADEQALAMEIMGARLARLGYET
jgi:hypothetical protein